MRTHQEVAVSFFRDASSNANKTMKPQFRLYRRYNGGRFYLAHNVTGKQESWAPPTARKRPGSCMKKTKHPANHCSTCRLPAHISSRMTRKLGHVFGRMSWMRLPSPSRRQRSPFVSVASNRRRLTRFASFPSSRRVLSAFFMCWGAGTVATNKNLRRLHSYALSMTWLPWPLAPGGGAHRSTWIGF